MIPAFNHSGVLPPFIGTGPQVGGAQAPYACTIDDFAARFGTTGPRLRLLQGLLSYRQDLRALGYRTGVQWIGGSFTEDVERHSGRDPRDIDVVTLTPVNALGEANFDAIIQANEAIFNPKISKQKYSCDAYIIDMALDPFVIAELCTYWYGLFSHNRAGHLWKGMLSIDLSQDDTSARDWVEMLS